MNKIRIIDLLNKNANKEKIPKQIKYLNTIYKYNEHTGNYYKDGDCSYKNNLYFQLFDSDKLNDTVEIIEESEQEIDKTTTKHVMIDEENLKNLIRNHYRWEDYTLQGKIDIVTSLAYFDNSNDLIDFIKYVGV